MLDTSCRLVYCKHGSEQSVTSLELVMGHVIHGMHKHYLVTGKGKVVTIYCLFVSYFKNLLCGADHAL